MFTINAELLKQKRLSMKLSQDQVAKKLFITQSHYNRIELGKAMPSIDEMQLIITFFKIDPKEILKEITPMNINNSGNNVQIGFLNNTMEYTNNNIDDEVINKIQKSFQEIIHLLMEHFKKEDKK